MRRKGLFEWKIVAAILAVLIVASSAVLSNEGVKDFFMDFTGSTDDWLKNSPFGGIFSAPEKGTNAVSIVIYTENITLSMDSPVNVTGKESSIEGFKGTIDLNFRDNSTVFIPANGMVIRMKMQDMSIRDVKISSLTLEGVDFTVTSDKTNITGTNDRIEIYGFSGDIEIAGHLKLDGNVSRAKNGKWSIG